MGRVGVLILDSFGIGKGADAVDFGDEGADTLGHIAEVFLEKKGRGLSLPFMESLGLLEAYRENHGVFPVGMGSSWEGVERLSCSFGVASEISSGKDTPSGHWEMMGVPVMRAWGTFPQKTGSFPPKILAAIEQTSGVKGFLGNCHASGTEIIDKLGQKHMDTGKPIYYTSIDSVFQVACHEARFGLERLYKLCQCAREILYSYRVGRVIARPFVGDGIKGFERTGNRRDYTLAPPSPTLLDKWKASGRQVIGIGKIGDIFAHRGLTREVRASGHAALWQATRDVWHSCSSGSQALIMANFVDFDAVYGYRRDALGYGEALEAFDRELGCFLEEVGSDDTLILTADHGNDPTWQGMDHTRESVPVLWYPPRREGIDNWGKRASFCDLAETLAQMAGLSPFSNGASFF